MQPLNEASLKEIRDRDESFTKSLLASVNMYREMKGMPTWKFDSSATVEEWTMVIDSEGKTVISGGLHWAAVPAFIAGAEAMTK